MMEARHIGVSIACPLEMAYAFAHRPETFPQWAAGMADSLRREGERWVAGTPLGEAEVRFNPPNDYGVLDHVVVLPGKPEIHVPLRLIANGDSTEAVFTLFRHPGMSDADFDDDATAVQRDLQALKALLERGDFKASVRPE